MFERYVRDRVWVKYYDEDVPRDVSIPRDPLYVLLDNSARMFPSRPALIFYGRRVSYSSVLEGAERFAYAVRKRWGLGEGDVIALLLPNVPHFPIAMYGGFKAGVAVTPINPLYTGYEIARQVEKSRARVLVALDIFAERVEEAIKEFGADVDVIVYGSVADYLPRLVGFLYRLKERRRIVFDGERIVRFRDVLASSAWLRERPRIDPLEDTAVLMFTGGTTGEPKGTMLTHYNIMANVVQIDSWWHRGRKGEDVMVGVLPWFHIYGQTAVLHTGFYRAATILAYPRFELDRILRDIGRYKANIFHGVPTIYSKIVSMPGIERFNLESIEVCISGAGALPKAVAERFEALTGARLREGYGLTEASPVTHINPIYGVHKPGSIGVPVPGTLAAIADPEKPILLPPGVKGEIVVSGPQVMKGYIEPEANNKVFFECCGLKWLRTGDIGYMDEDGFFYVVDRKKDIIKYKGYTVYPREVEEALYEHECVVDAAVIGVPHPHVGERVKAFVTLRDECKGRVSGEELIAFLEKRLARYKIPKEIEIREELPKTPVGKILRRLLREEEAKKAAGLRGASGSPSS